jgi:hypothetical protein
MDLSSIKNIEKSNFFVMEIHILSDISIPATGISAFSALFSIDEGCACWYIIYVAKAVMPYTY